MKASYLQKEQTMAAATAHLASAVWSDLKENHVALKTQVT